MGNEPVRWTVDDFPGTARYEPVRRLGSGGFGVVYEVFDREQERRVALKTLRSASPENVLRFKREFRALADVGHRNLVQLHELESDGSLWFFTMELVDGVDALEYVALAKADGTEVDSPSRRTAFDRLRSVVVQLMEGVSALHAAGTLHRDIKPGNVLVTGQGRVVLLDFGLAAAARTDATAGWASSQVVGTPAYMSPEQAAGLPMTEASDLYSVGVLLHEALTGYVPFEGGPLEVMAAKQHRDPPPPGLSASGVPGDLDILCAELLRREPGSRPKAGEVIRRLGYVPQEEAVLPLLPAGSPVPFVGRVEALASLLAAAEEVRRGRPAVVTVSGGSGVGKTALVRRFVDALSAADRQAVVLPGRCHDREAVPFKALDSLIDALTGFLRHLRPAEAERLLPRDVLALARLFPVLRQVEAVSAARRRVLEIPDSQELRRRGVGALRELLGRVAEERLLVLSVDDLQWADADSLALLADVLRPPDPPALLLLLAVRVEPGAPGGPGAAPVPGPSSGAANAGSGVGAPFADTGALAASSREVRLVELPEVEAREMARLLLRGATRSPGATPEEAQVAMIARESRGNPFFIDALVRYLQRGAPAEGLPADATLDDLVRVRLAALPAGARRALDVVAVAGRPTPAAVVRRVAELAEEDSPELALLRTEHLVRSRRHRALDELEPWHDRIREVVRAEVPAEALGPLHARLALQFEVSGLGDPELLAYHLEGAGELERASEQAEKGARRAEELLAFDRAARLYRKARALGSEPSRVRALGVRLGDALNRAGRGAEAAEEYLAAVPGARAAERLELQRRAAEQLFRGGHLDEGLDVIRLVLAAVGMRLPSTPRRAFLALLPLRLLARLRGLSYHERDSSQIAPAQLTRIDVCWSVATGLAMVDVIQGQVFQAQHLLLALDAGEPYRMARALAVEVASRAIGGGRSRERTRRLQERTRLLVERAGHPHALGLSRFGDGMAALLEGRYLEATRRFAEAEEILKERCTGVAWELDNAEILGLLARTVTGDWLEVARRLPALVQEARGRGDLWAVTNLRIRASHVVALAADEPERAREEVTRALAEWSRQGYHLQHYWALFALVETALYAGPGPAAQELLEGEWRRLARSLLLRVQRTRIEALHLRARAALSAANGAAAARGAAPSVRRMLEVAERNARLVLNEEMPWGDALAGLVLAAVAVRRGRAAEGRSALESAVAGLEAAGLGLYAAAGRRQLGLLQGGDGGCALVAEADARIAAQGVRNPARLARMLAPGFGY